MSSQSAVARAGSQARVRGLVLVCSLAFSACGGDSPAAPTPTPLNLTGAWSGTWTFVTAGVTVSDTVTITLTQTGTSVTGQWSAATGPTGTLTFTSTADFSGTATIIQTLINGVNCTASTPLAGTASSTQIRLTLTALTPTGLCQWGTSQQFTLSR